MGASWRTLLYGAVGVLGVIFTQIGYGLDNDPDTVTNWDLVMKSIGTLLQGTGFFGIGFFARDDKVTSEQAKAKP